MPSDTLTLTFINMTLLESALVETDGEVNHVHYNTSTTAGREFSGRKVTTIMASSGLMGVIDWRGKFFKINGVRRARRDLKSRPGGIISSDRRWRWDPSGEAYTFSYDQSHSPKELLATPDSGSQSGIVRLTTATRHLFRADEPAVLEFPVDMQDDVERMFLLMVILKTEMRRQDAAHSGAVVRGVGR
ncbi:hypothetical protein C8R43DRAFT_121539 [Mycena crocata]|nr:hypothetical protein C8R43DRAFT_121539 [Mycena crocata]